MVDITTDTDLEQLRIEVFVIGSLKTDHEALADAVHGVVGRLMMIESRLDHLEDFVRAEAAAQHDINARLSEIVKSLG